MTHPKVKDIKDFESWPDALVFLQSDPHGFVKTRDYPPDDFPQAYKRQIIVFGENRKTGYQHVPTTCNRRHLTGLCRMLSEEDVSSEIDLPQFLQIFVSQLRGEMDLQRVANKITAHVSELFQAEGAAILVLDRDKDSLRFAASHSVSEDVRQRLNEIEIPNGTGIAGWVATNRKPILVDDPANDTRFFGQVDQKTNFQTRDLLAAPIILGDDVLGVLEVVNCKPRPFSEWDLPNLSVISAVVAIFLERAQLLSQKKRILNEAGKAEIANSVLHNIGNVLNSVTVSCELMDSHLERLSLPKLQQTVEIINQHIENLGAFFDKHPKGKMVPPYLDRLSNTLLAEQKTLLREVRKISGKMRLMREIIETQQTIARMGPTEAQDLIQMVEEGIAVAEPFLERQETELVREFQTDKPIRAQKSKVVHILINLIKNGAEAMRHLPVERRIVRVETVELRDGRVCIRISDCGIGIAPEIRGKLFGHGFTTKEDGHGFGLNFCAKAMEEMNGSIEVESRGKDKGATFILTFPDINASNFLNI